MLPSPPGMEWLQSNGARQGFVSTSTRPWRSTIEHCSHSWELCHLAKALAPGDHIWDRCAASFPKLFYDAIEFFGISSLGLAPYSLRRGGATHSFQTAQSLESILLRGRRRALAVARLYIEAGQAELAQMQIPKSSLQILHRFNKGIPSEMLA